MWIGLCRRSARTVDIVMRTCRTRDGGHTTVGHDLAYRGVVGIGHIQVACAVNCHTPRKSKQRRQGDATTGGGDLAYAPVQRVNDVDVDLRINGYDVREAESHG